MKEGFEVRLSEDAEDDLRRLDGDTQKRLYKWLRRRLSECINPRALGEPLSAELSEYWKYRSGDYRIIAKILDDKVIVFVIALGHRKDIYKKLKRRTR